MKVKKQVFRIITAAAVLFILALTLSVLLSAVCLHVQHYEIELRGLQSKVRLVLLSDLHCKSFGKDNARLLAKVEAQSPDAICLAGDMIDRNADAEDVQKFLVLLKHCVKSRRYSFHRAITNSEYMASDERFLDRMMKPVRRCSMTVMRMLFLRVSRCASAAQWGMGLRSAARKRSLPHRRNTNS